MKKNTSEDFIEELIDKKYKNLSVQTVNQSIADGTY